VESMRWIRGLVPLAAVALMGAGAGARPDAFGVTGQSWEPPPCAAAGPPGAAGEASTGRGDPAWYRLDGMLDDSGTLVGQRLTVGVAGGAERRLDLPPESFASGPVDGVILVGEDDGLRSRLSLLDVGRGCVTHLADETAVIRSALLAPDGSAAWEHRVDRSTRADLGVWRRPFDGRPARRRLLAVPPDERYGRTFATELRLAPDGRVAVTSCGEIACRTRLLDAESGRVTTIGPTGPVIGVAEDGSVVAQARCAALPCAIVAAKADGRVTTLVPVAGRAAMAGNRVVFETAGHGIEALDLRTGSIAAVQGDGLIPLGAGSKATAGADHGPDDVLLARAGVLGGRGMVLTRGSLRPIALQEADR